MAQWHVTQGDNQFAIDGGLAELEAMARRGDLHPGDMIQPPGAADWMYASEVQELAAVFSRRRDDDDDDERPASAFAGMGVLIAGAVAAVLLGVILVGGGAMLYLVSSMQGGGGDLIGGEGGLTFSEMIVTATGTGLHGEPNDHASITTPVPKDDVLDLLAKRGQFYRARTKSGAEGWIPIAHVIPMYQLGGAKVRDEYDPLYNPDRYVEVSNARWMQLPNEHPTPGNELSNITVFEFAMANSSRYPMADVKIVATIKDAQGHELEKVEIPVEGEIPPGGETMVGTLYGVEPDAKGRKPKPKPDEVVPPDRILTTSTFDEMAVKEPELQLRWTSGVQVEMQAAEFTNAEIDIVELRAVPDAKAAKDVRR